LISPRYSRCRWTQPCRVATFSEMLQCQIPRTEETLEFDPFRADVEEERTAERGVRRPPRRCSTWRARQGEQRRGFRGSGAPCCGRAHIALDSRLRERIVWPWLDRLAGGFGRTEEPKNGLGGRQFRDHRFGAPDGQDGALEVPRSGLAGNGGVKRIGRG
jgi:hypothetical protein